MHKKRIVGFSILTAVLAGVSVSIWLISNRANGYENLEAHIYEMRTYSVAPGRLEDLHTRFQRHTNHLFEKHGMKLIGYWTPVGKEDTLVYLLAHRDRESAEESWQGFFADPVWQKVQRESEPDGQPLVTDAVVQFLEPTDYSPLR